MATKKFDVVATVGEYTAKDGSTKKRYMNVGVCFENDEGQLSIKLETIPVGPNWSGWLSLYEPKERDAAPVTKHSAAKANAFVSGDSQINDLSDIPF